MSYSMRTKNTTEMHDYQNNLRIMESWDWKIVGSM